MTKEEIRNMSQTVLEIVGYMARAQVTKPLAEKARRHTMLNMGIDMGNGLVNYLYEMEKLAKS